MSWNLVSIFMGILFLGIFSFSLLSIVLTNYIKSLININEKDYSEDIDLINKRLDKISPTLRRMDETLEGLSNDVLKLENRLDEISLEKLNSK